MQKITTILFDFDGTLYHHDPNNDKHYWEFVETLGVIVTSEMKTKTEQWSHYYFANSEEIQRDKEKIEDNHSSFWCLYNRRKLEQLGNYNDKTLDDWAKEISDYLDTKISDDATLGDDVIETLSWMKPNYKLGLITNRSNPIDQHLEHLKIDHFFDTAYAAGEVGFWKPSPLIFERAFSELEITPEEAIYVGDNHFADIAAAKNANMLPILMDPNKTYEEPDCEVISKISDLIPFLKKLSEN